MTAHDYVPRPSEPAETSAPGWSTNIALPAQYAPQIGSSVALAEKALPRILAASGARLLIVGCDEFSFRELSVWALHEAARAVTRSLSGLRHAGLTHVALAIGEDLLSTDTRDISRYNSLPVRRRMVLRGAERAGLEVLPLGAELERPRDSIDLTLHDRATELIRERILAHFDRLPESRILLMASNYEISSHMPSFPELVPLTSRLSGRIPHENVWCTNFLDPDDPFGRIGRGLLSVLEPSRSYIAERPTGAASSSTPGGAPGRDRPHVLFPIPDLQQSLDKLPF